MPVSSEETFIQLILETHSALQAETDLSPKNDTINNTLGPYVEAILDADRQGLNAQEIIDDPRVSNIRPAMLQLLWQAEMEMELHFSKFFIEQYEQTGETPDLKQFRYLDNYLELVEDEVEAIVTASQGREPKKVAFIGSGPLPLSALLFHKKTGMHVTCIDINLDASEMGRALMQALGYNEDTIAHYNLDGAEIDYADFDLVFMATMTGNKKIIAERIKETAHNDCMVAVRSAENLRALLYEVIDPDDYDGLVQTLLLHARDTVVNCTHCFQQVASIEEKMPIVPREIQGPVALSA